MFLNKNGSWQLAAGDKEDEDLGEVNGAKEDDKETIYMY